LSSRDAMYLSGCGRVTRRDCDRIHALRVEEGKNAVYERPPRWFDRLLCFIGWALLILMGHCTALRIQADLDRPNINLEEPPLIQPSYPHEP
jgi:hypothetical protein